MTCDAAAAERGDYQGKFRPGAAHNLFLGDRLDGLPKITNRLEGTADKKYYLRVSATQALLDPLSFMVGIFTYGLPLTTPTGPRNQIRAFESIRNAGIIPFVKC
jgi:hypothetical protein